MCIDFTSLNKFCPKDSYPLPLIDQLIDRSAGYELLSFLDAHSKYNQISLHKCDEEKTSFTSEIGTFCYTRMPFGLKNAGATFQRLVDRVFKSQINRNVEVYVDDILIKSKMRENHLKDIKKTFDNLRSSGIKIKPSKCIFGVNKGKFLGYIITSKGIKPNPDKIEAIKNLEIPKNLKEVQSLNGKIAALHRFISCSADKYKVFFRLTKNYRGKINWNDKCNSERRSNKSPHTPNSKGK